MRVAGKKRIKNVTRAQHRRSLEKAVRHQTAATQETRGRVFLPRLSKHEGGEYAQVVETGRELFLEREGAGRSEMIVSCYSRNDVQQTMHRYAWGRRISIPRNFRPMFRGSPLRRPDDILPIMMFYSHEPFSERTWEMAHRSTLTSQGRQ